MAGVQADVTTVCGCTCGHDHGLSVRRRNWEWFQGSQNPPSRKPWPPLYANYILGRRPTGMATEHSPAQKSR
jgi:hypothetical protein